MINEPWTANDPHSKVFQVVALSLGMFVNPSVPGNGIVRSRDEKRAFSGKVTCSLPFSKHLGSRPVSHNLIWAADLLISTIASPDGRACLALGCAEGLWIGYRNDSRLELEGEVCAPTYAFCCSGTSVTALRRVSDLKMVTQCAMLEEFGIFLVLANKVKCPFVS